MKKVLFITPADASHGFALAGAAQEVVAAAEAEAALVRVAGEPDTAVAAIDERLLGGIGEDRLRALEKRWSGVLVVLPAPATTAESAEDYALRLIRRAIGYHVRMR
ncbi:V-type ATP synthase subunit F [Geomesophilobacter sediminis]|uniref:ATPase n=1 Tax=Geomesophilobacter sediminis TaxID=2798584 RepID=A0A8J7J306_9BACT|nr:V-type ATP synthase subunit F [Geomesophilobacter sediminis]MBJ6725173.1 ATPase [Geomesophilobacter sediminis]